ncbi:prion-like-(Q/N-rich) domain-bearing protein 25 [Penaeus vannamei]|uniref:prion-like-(Q/N-rich) domain-bearing protein 25 n=1 Tax=Penaeus vannamei TaxID=6689 RepID=UPI00387F4CA1
MGEFSRNIVILIFAAVCIWITNGEIGGKCIYSYDCPGQASCKNNHCTCPEIEYSESLYPECNWRSQYCIRTEYCSKNAQCIDHVCVCDEGYYRMESSCRKGQLQPVMSTCRVTRQALWMCDISKHSLCINDTCVCATGYIPTADGSCEPQESYMKKYSLSDYRVKPGEYCRKSANCIEGLECQGFKCRCPVACRYDQRKEICDCGEVESTNGPIYLGIFLGLLVILFWCCTIKRTIRKMMIVFLNVKIQYI